LCFCGDVCGLFFGILVSMGFGVLYGIGVKFVYFDWFVIVFVGDGAM